MQLHENILYWINYNPFAHYPELNQFSQIDKFISNALCTQNKFSSVCWNINAKKMKQVQKIIHMKNSEIYGMFDTFSFVSGANRTGMGEMGVLACHGLVIRRDIFFFSIKHWLRHLPRTDGRMEGNGRHSKKRSSRTWKIWLTMHCLLLFLSFNKVVGGTILQSSKIDWLQPPLHPTPGNKKTGDFLDPFVKSSYAQSVLVRDQREFSFSLKIKLEIERKSFRSDTRLRERNSFSHLESQNRLLVKHWL